MDDVLAEMRSHLELLGYGITVEGDLIIVQRSDKPSFGLWSSSAGIMFMCLFDVRPEGVSTDLAGFMKFLNSANLGSEISRFYWDEDVADPKLRGEAWFPNWYEKKTFGRFLDVWLEEIGDVAKRGKSFIS